MGYRDARSGRADVQFELKSVPAEMVKLEMLDSAGSVIRTMNGKGRPGLNKVAWNLRYDPPRQVEMRHTPPEQPFIWDDPRFVGKETRGVFHWGIQGPQTNGPLAAPGRYSARVTVNGKSQIRPFTILLDKDVAQPAADLAASTKAQIKVRDDMNAAVEMINRIEVMRRQIEDVVKADTTKADAKTALRALDKQIKEVELQLLSNADMLSDDKYFSESYKIYMKLIWLNGDIGTGAGDVAGGADFKPTDASLDHLAGIEKDLKAATSDFKKLMDKTIADFNRLWAGKLKPITDAKIAM